MVLLIGSRPWSVSIALALAARALFIPVAVIGAWLLTSELGPPQTGWPEMWRRWDAHHFLTIAEFGYTSSESDAHAAAFFPGFPLAVRAVMMFFGIPPVLAGLIVAAAASIVAGYYLYRLADSELGEVAARRAVLYLTLFPTAVFLIAPYSESLFLAGAIAAFYYARRERWHLVALPAAVAMGARAAGLFLLFGLLFEFIRQKDFSKTRVANAAVALAIGMLPLLAYGAFLSQAMGDPLEFLTHQREGWGRTYVGPISSLLNTWNTWESGTYPTNWLLAWRIEIVAAVLGLVAVVWASVKREWGYAAFMGSFLAALVTSTWYYSIPRMLLSMFPIVLFLSEATKRRSALHDWLVVGFATFSTFGVIVYTRGIWFY